MDHRGRLTRIQERLKREEIGALFITNLVNIRYLCGFTGSNGYLLVTREAAWLFTDGRYSVQASQEVAEAEVVICLSHSEVMAALSEKRRHAGLSKIAFEAPHVSVASAGPGWSLPPGLDKLESYFQHAELIATSEWVEEIRRIKEPAELAAIRTAAEIADSGFDYILEKAGAGSTEKQIALDLEFFLRNAGADDVSFDPIVAAGERSALPHARPSERETEKGRYLLLDFGCLYAGYCSDMTRTLIIGPADDRHREIYEIVLAAQEAGLAAAISGAAAGDVDKAARDVISLADFGEAFSHGLGHGVGLEIHEAPTLRANVEATLEPGNVITIEPGVYLEGWGGVRIEDLAVVTEGRVEVLSKSSKQLIVL